MRRQPPENVGSSPNRKPYRGLGEWSPRWAHNPKTQVRILYPLLDNNNSGVRVLLALKGVCFQRFESESGGVIGKA
jgi:hypothetical protein